jgi:hypothetical protein
LHLSDDEVKVLIERAKRERELMDDVSGLPLHKIAANPDHAVEHYKFLLGQIRQINLLANQELLEVSLAKPDRLTETEIQLWRLINRQNTSPN